MKLKFSHKQLIVVFSLLSFVFSVSAHIRASETIDKYSFEYFEPKSNKKHLYHVFYEKNNDNKYYLWATGNPGFAFTNSNEPAESYPTYSTPNGYSGRGVAMVTRSTGFVGSVVNMPIAAGNLFIGNFNTSAISSPSNVLKATQLGKPFDKAPLFFKGWYKYTPGKVFTNNKDKVVEGKVDELEIYAVFYEPTAQNPFYTPESSVIAIARLKDRSAKSTYTFFKIPFEYKAGKVVDPEKLKNLKYSLTIICSSSIDGAKFNGAVGSTLIVDELEIISNKD